MFDHKFSKSEEALELFLHLCDQAYDCEMTMIDLALVLQHLGKFVFAFNLP